MYYTKMEGKWWWWCQQGDTSLKNEPRMLVFKGGGHESVGKEQPPSKTSIRGSFLRVDVRGLPSRLPHIHTSTHPRIPQLPAVLLAE